MSDAQKDDRSIQLVAETGNPKRPQRAGDKTMNATINYKLSEIGQKNALKAGKNAHENQGVCFEIATAWVDKIGGVTSDGRYVIMLRNVADVYNPYGPDYSLNSIDFLIETEEDLTRAYEVMLAYKEEKTAFVKAEAIRRADEKLAEDAKRKAENAVNKEQDAKRAREKEASEKDQVDALRKWVLSEKGTELAKLAIETNHPQWERVCSDEFITGHTPNGYVRDDTDEWFARLNPSIEELKEMKKMQLRAKKSGGIISEVRNRYVKITGDDTNEDDKFGAILIDITSPTGRTWTVYKRF